MKYSTVTNNVINQGRFLVRSARSCRIVVRSSTIGRMRSRVVRKVMMKNTMPMLAKKIIALWKPTVLSPSPSISTSGSSSTWMMNCATITATKRYADMLLRSFMLPVSTPLSAAYGRLLAA